MKLLQILLLMTLNLETVEVDGRKPEDPPADEVEQPTAEQEPEEQTDETDS